MPPSLRVYEPVLRLSVSSRLLIQDGHVNTGVCTRLWWKYR